VVGVKNAIAVANSVRPHNVEPWIDNPNVTVVCGRTLIISLLLTGHFLALWAVFGGSDGENGTKDVHYGDPISSGRIPNTIARDNGDKYLGHLVPDSYDANYPTTIPYTEGCVPTTLHTGCFTSTHEVVTSRLLPHRPSSTRFRTSEVSSSSCGGRC